MKDCKTLLFNTPDELFEALQDLVDAGVLRKTWDYKRTNLIYYPKGTYILRHGEYARPDFRPRKTRDGKWGVYVRYYYYQGTLNRPHDGFVCEEWLESMRLAVEDIEIADSMV